jgi:predicted PurR-regulated permease PerM
MPDRFPVRVLTAGTIVVGIIALAALMWQGLNVILLVFAGILLAILLRALSDWVSRLTRLPEGWSLALVLIVLAALLGLAGWLRAPEVADEFRALSEQLPRSIDKLNGYVQRFGIHVPQPADVVRDHPGLLNKMTGAVSATFGFLANAFIVFLVGIYLAADPALYRRGVVSLFPRRRLARASDLLGEVGQTLRSWLMGKLTGMAFVDAAITAGLALLGVPLAFSLGLIAGLLDFIPNIGPLISAVPAVLLALMQSPVTALYVALLYLAVQTVESYIMIPMIQKKAVSLPPALTIVGQVLFGVVLGGLGLMMATPILAAAITVVTKLYVEPMRVGEE